MQSACTMEQASQSRLTDIHNIAEGLADFGGRRALRRVLMGVAGRSVTDMRPLASLRLSHISNVLSEICRCRTVTVVKS
jgi:hypothetical protein